MRIEQRQRRAANQLPAAGRHQRIDAGLAAADADGAGRHRQTRLSAARRRQLFRHAAQIGETRLKAEEIDHVGRRRVAFHHLPRRHAGMARHFIQIGALLPAVDHRNIHLTRFRRQALFAFPTLLQQCEHRFGVGLRRMQQQRQVIHPRHHFPHVGVVIQLSASAQMRCWLGKVTGGDSSSTTALSPNR